MARYAVNEAAVTRCQELISAKQYVLDSDWGEVQPDASAQNSFLERHDWEQYAAWHLGLTDGAKDETKARYAFVYGDLRRVHRTGLIACVYRASEWRHKAVELAAHACSRSWTRQDRHRCDPDSSAVTRWRGAGRDVLGGRNRDSTPGSDRSTRRAQV